jgi:DNA-binding TFAR19-related protein (PDSD5 family)
MWVPKVSDGEPDDLAAIRLKKLQEFQRRMAAAQEKPQQVKDTGPDDMTLVRSKLVSRGNEVLNAALIQYPKAADAVVSQIAKLYHSGRLKESIPGEELLLIFQDLGLRVHLETTISYIKDGKRVSLSDRFKEKD